VITLYRFGPAFGLPEGSPFALKTMLHLQWAGLSYKSIGVQDDRRILSRAPKGRLPYIDDDGIIVADSTFIRFHVEKKYGVDFDERLTDAQRSMAWALEKMCEEHLYFALVDFRWRGDINFYRGPAQFFASIPVPLRSLVRSMVRRGNLRQLREQGIGVHSEEEVAKLACRDIDTLATILGGNQFLTGDRRSGADAFVAALIGTLRVPLFETPIRTHLEKQKNLCAYSERILSEL
jgi:glutathione S-transferase